MKCPKCGYVSFPSQECRKCGYHFAQTQDTKTTPETGAVPSGEVNRAAASGTLRPEAGRDALRPPPERAAFDATLDSAGMPETARPETLSRSETEMPPAPDLSERVASFRRRRDAEKSGRERTLQFDFDLQTQEKSTNLAAHLSSAPRAGNAAAEHALDKAFEEREAREAERRTAPPRGRLEPELARIPRNVPENFVSRAQPAPIEFMDAGFTVSDYVEDADESEIIAAPIRKRFVAGLVDAVLLVLAACLFAVIFSLIGGHLQSTPVDLVIAAWMAAFCIFAYFASFSAIVLSTPGQAAMGLAVRNLEGELPTRQESLLRAFGYLVSIGSLMLGFLWAAMDSDGLAWHDHISGTFLTED